MEETKQSKFELTSSTPVGPNWISVTGNRIESETLLLSGEGQIVVLDSFVVFVLFFLFGLNLIVFDLIGSVFMILHLQLWYI